MDHDRRRQRDARRLAGDPEAAALFECLVKHAFDPALDSRFIAKKCGAPRRVRDRLVAKIGPLGKYAVGLRMTEAKQLVLETELTIDEIGKRVGYSVQRSFRRAFGSAHGMSPLEMRQQARSGDGSVTQAATEAPDPTSPPAGNPGAGEAESGPARRAWADLLRRQLELGMFEPRFAGELRLELRRRQPRLDKMDAEPREVKLRPVGPGSYENGLPAVLTPTGDRLEEVAADAAFDTILALPPADRRFALLQGLRLGTITAFDHLFRFCRQRVHLDAERSLSVARLGVELVDVHREQMGDDVDQWKAKAWVHLGGVQVYAGDYGGAEESLGFAAAEVGGDERLEPWVEIELRKLEGLLRRSQRRDAEAVRALDRALELGRQLDSGDPIRSESVLQRLELASHLADAETGFALTEELEKLIDGGSEPGPHDTLWHGLIAFHRAQAYAATGIEDAAEGILRRALADINTAPDYSSDPELGVLSTFILHDLARLVSRGDRLDEGESLLRLVVERYQLLELPVLKAAGEAELAAVCALRGRRAEARQLASSSADFLDDLPVLHREARGAARRLRVLANGGAVAPEEDLRKLLVELQRDLDRVTWEIPDARVTSASRAGQSRVGSAPEAAQRS